MPNIGGIQLPAFIILIIFGPFALSYICFIIWHYTVRRYRDKKQLKTQAEQEEGRNRDVEMQVRGLVQQGGNVSRVAIPARVRPRN
jgi:membrane protein implicated in regulation of membrane protease activity